MQGQRHCNFPKNGMTGSDTEVCKVILTAEVKFLSIGICINLDSTRKFEFANTLCYKTLRSLESDKGKKKMLSYFNFDLHLHIMSRLSLLCE